MSRRFVVWSLQIPPAFTSCGHFLADFSQLALSLGFATIGSFYSDPKHSDQSHEVPEAMVIDGATTHSDATSLADPLHTQVTTAEHSIPIGVHPAVGGDGDAPLPGELLAAALASCIDSTLRVIANRLDIQLCHLAVSAVGEVDVRGTLMVSDEAAAGFVGFKLVVEIEAAPDTKPALLKALVPPRRTAWSCKPCAMAVR